MYIRFVIINDLIMYLMIVVIGYKVVNICYYNDYIALIIYISVSTFTLSSIIELSLNRISRMLLYNNGILCTIPLINTDSIYIISSIYIHLTQTY